MMMCIQRCYKSESGNVVFYVLLGIVLVGLLTVALRNSGGTKGDIDTEDAALKATQVQNNAAEIGRAVATLLTEQVSEADIRFAPPDDASTQYGNITTTPANQVFSSAGARATYRLPPAGIQTAVANWEFFATSQIPQVGSDKAELIAVLPNVTQEFCEAINRQLGFTGATQPLDSATGTTPDCVNGTGPQRFVGSFNDISPNVLDKTSFSKLPVLEACVKCASDDTYNYFYVLMAR